MDATTSMLGRSAGGTGTLRNVARFGVLLAARVVTGRKRTGAGLANEQHFPHLVEVAVSPEGLRDALLEFDALHRERRIPVHRSVAAKSINREQNEYNHDAVWPRFVV
jgi:hypothetical protein